jgi:hypothetical protein
MGVTMKRFSMGDAFTFSIETIKKYPLLVLVPAYLLKVYEIMISEYLNNRNVIERFRPISLSIIQWFRNLPLPQSILWVLFSLVVILGLCIIYSTVAIGQIRIGIYAFDNQDNQINGSVYNNFGKKVLLPFVAASLLLLVIIVLGLFFIVIPGWILYLMFLFTLFVLVEKKVSIPESFRTSYRLTNGVKWSLASYYFVCFLIILCISVPLGLFVSFLGRYANFLKYILQPTLQVFFTLATIFIYKDLCYQDSYPNEPKDPKEPIDESIQLGDGTRIPLETLLNQ